MFGLGSCLGRKQQEKKDESMRKSEKEEQRVDQMGDRTSELAQVDRSPSQTSASVTIGQGITSELNEQIPRTNIIEMILKKLEAEDVGKVVLHGKHGIGKTWIAREVTKQAFLKKNFDVIVWVYNGQIQYSSVLHQISIQQNSVGADYYLGEDGVKQDLIIQSLQHKLMERKILLVFDNDGDVVEAENDAALQLEKNLISNADKSSKVLITAPIVSDVIMTSYDTNSHAEAVEIKPLTPLESRDLLIRGWKNSQIRLLLDDDLDDIVKRCKYLPAAIVFTGNMLMYALENALDDNFREMIIKEAKKEINDYWMLGCSSGFEKFRNDLTNLKCLWLSVNYLHGHKSMNYNKLILFWMLDGCFDSTISLETAYANGHSVVIDFLNAGLLGERQAGDVVLERAGLKFAHCLFQITHERFTFEKFCNFYDLSRSGIVKRMSSSIGFFTKSIEGSSENVNLVTLLLKGNDTSKLDQVKFDKRITKNIRIMFASVVEPLISLQNMCPFISVLILKDCHSVSHDNISDIATLTHLMVLEISGCSSLEKIPEDFFTNFELLESLNLSANPIKAFPRLTFGLSNLRSLLLRRCLKLESLPDVNGLTELQLLDVLGSNFNSSNDKVWYLEELPELRVLDLSETDIYECPDLSKLDRLNSLYLKNCSRLRQLGLQTSSTELKVIEASGSSELEHIGELNSRFFISKLDLSSTRLIKIPLLRNARNLVHLSLKGCSELQELPPIEGAINLRILDASDAIQLQKMNVSFEDMISLQEIFLSNTIIKTLPSLSGLNSLRKLLLNGCTELQTLPKVDLLANLLLLDLRGCIALEPVSDEHLHHIIVLK